MMDNAEAKLGTKMPNPMHTIQQRISDPCEMARPIAFLLSNYSTYMAGQNVMVDGGWVC